MNDLLDGELTIRGRATSLAHLFLDVWRLDICRVRESRVLGNLWLLEPHAYPDLQDALLELLHLLNIDGQQVTRRLLRRHSFIISACIKMLLQDIRGLFAACWLQSQLFLRLRIVLCEVKLLNLRLNHRLRSSFGQDSGTSGILGIRLDDRPRRLLLCCYWPTCLPPVVDHVATEILRHTGIYFATTSGYLGGCGAGGACRMLIQARIWF